MRVDCSFDRPERSGSARRPIVEHERKPGSWSAYAHVKKSPIRQTNMIEYVHATILAFHPRTPVSFATARSGPSWCLVVTSDTLAVPDVHIRIVEPRPASRRQPARVHVVRLGQRTGYRGMPGRYPPCT